MTICDEEVFTLGQMAQCVPKTVISAAPHILLQNILDTQENVFYAAKNKQGFDESSMRDAFAPKK
jgi:hypothetical protein